MLETSLAKNVSAVKILSWALESKLFSVRSVMETSQVQLNIGKKSCSVFPFFMIVTVLGLGTKFPYEPSLHLLSDQALQKHSICITWQLGNVEESLRICF